MSQNCQIKLFELNLCFSTYKLEVMKTKLALLKIEFLVQSLLMFVNSVLLVLLISLNIKYTFLFFCISQLFISAFQYGISLPVHFVSGDDRSLINSWRIKLLIMGCINVLFILLMHVTDLNLNSKIVPLLVVVPQILIYLYYYISYKNFKGIKSYVAHEHILNTKF